MIVKHLNLWKFVFTWLYFACEIQDPQYLGWKKKDIENNKGDFKCSFSGSSEKYFDKLHIIG